MGISDAYALLITGRFPDAKVARSDPPNQEAVGSRRRRFDNRKHEHRGAVAPGPASLAAVERTAREDNFAGAVLLNFLAHDDGTEFD